MWVCPSVSLPELLWPVEDECGEVVDVCGVLRGCESVVRGEI